MAETQQETPISSGNGAGGRGPAATRCLCEGAIMVALAQVLSYIKFYEAPYGGSITLGMFPILFFAYRWGVKSGILVGFTYGLLQLIFDGAYAWGWQSMLMDYLLAFTPLGLAGLFSGKKLQAKLGTFSLYAGFFLGAFGRFLIHFVAGATIWKSYMPEDFTNPYFYSLVYNGGYMLPSTILCLLMTFLLQKSMKSYFLGEDIQHLKK
ncbi:MAG: energy-coupled thiamine transporter ThiT [Eubacteriales bacterium]